MVPPMSDAVTLKLNGVPTYPVAVSNDVIGVTLFTIVGAGKRRDCGMISFIWLGLHQ